MSSGSRFHLACGILALFLAACRPATPDMGISGRIRYAEPGGKVWVDAHLLDSALRVLTLSWDSLDVNSTRCEDWKIRKGGKGDLRSLARAHLRPGHLRFQVRMDTLSHLGMVVLLRGGDSTFLFVDNTDSVASNRSADSIRQALIGPLRSLFASPEECPEGTYLFLHPVPVSHHADCLDTANPLVITPEEASRYGYLGIFAGAGGFFEFPVHFESDPIRADNLSGRLYPTPAGCRGTLVRRYRGGTFLDRRL